MKDAVAKLDEHVVRAYGILDDFLDRLDREGELLFLSVFGMNPDLRM